MTMKLKKMKFYPHQNDHHSHLLYNQISGKKNNRLELEKINKKVKK